MGLINKTEKGLLKTGLIRQFGNITVSKEGITIGEQNAFGRTYDKGVDGFVDFQTNNLRQLAKGVTRTPADYVTFSQEGVTIGSKRNAFSRLKDRIIDFVI